MEVKLSSCPFCGSDDIDPSFVRGYQAGNLSQPIIAAGCMDCGASGKSVNVPDHSTGYAEAADAWNSRTTSDLEIVQKALEMSALVDDRPASLDLLAYGRWTVWNYKETSAHQLSNGNDLESLLTWAKQTVGEQ